uniref:HMG box domain-containing protein n=1 Tax=Schistocephalus solidus TaxID=70667 RepID=A0A183SX46_SCHSO
LREQLLQNGRNNLIMKSMQLQLLHQQLLVQGAMLPLSAASTSPASAAAAAAAAVASVSNPNAQCAAPSGSPVSSAAAPLTSALAASPAQNSLFEVPAIPLYAYVNQLVSPNPTLAAPKPLDPTAFVLQGSGVCPESHLPPDGTQPGLGAPRKRPAACFTEDASSPYGDRLEYAFAQPIFSSAATITNSSNNAGTNATDGNNRTVATSNNIANSTGLLTGPLNIFGMANYSGPSRLLSGCAGAAASVSPIICTPQSVLGVGLGPYLNAMAASSLNPMAAALNAAKAAAAAAAGPVSLASGSLPQLGLSGMISLPPTPAKRPALADAKSGLPMFQTDVPAVATVPMAATTAGLYALQTVSVPQSVSDPSQMAVDTTAAVMATTDQQTGGSIVKSAGQKADEESTQAAISFYPETCMLF